MGTRSLSAWTQCNVSVMWVWKAAGECSLVVSAEWEVTEESAASSQHSVLTKTLQAAGEFRSGIKSSSLA